MRGFRQHVEVVPTPADQAQVAQQMMAEHGKDFAMGTLVLAARWIAEGRMDRAKAN